MEKKGDGERDDEDGRSLPPSREKRLKPNDDDTCGGSLERQEQKPPYATTNPGQQKEPHGVDVVHGGINVALPGGSRDGEDYPEPVEEGRQKEEEEEQHGGRSSEAGDHGGTDGADEDDDSTLNEDDSWGGRSRDDDDSTSTSRGDNEELDSTSSSSSSGDDMYYHINFNDPEIGLSEEEEMQFTTIDMRFDRYKELFSAKDQRRRGFTKRVWKQLSLLPETDLSDMSDSDPDEKEQKREHDESKDGDDCDNEEGEQNKVDPYMWTETASERAKRKGLRKRKIQDWISYMKLSKEERKEQKRRYQRIVNRPRKCGACGLIKTKKQFFGRHPLNKKNYSGWKTEYEYRNGYANRVYHKEYGYIQPENLDLILHPSKYPVWHQDEEEAQVERGGEGDEDVDGKQETAATSSASSGAEFGNSLSKKKATASKDEGADKITHVIVGPCRACYLMQIEQRVRERYHDYHKKGICLNEFPTDLIQYFTKYSRVVPAAGSVDAGEVGQRAVASDNDENTEDDDDDEENNENKDCWELIRMHWGIKSIQEDSIFQKEGRNPGSASFCSELIGEYDIVYEFGSAGLWYDKFQRSFHNGKSTLSLKLGGFALDNVNSGGPPPPRDVGGDGAGTLLHGLANRQYIDKHEDDLNRYDFPGRADMLNGMNFKFIQKSVPSQQQQAAGDKYMAIELYDIPDIRLEKDDNGNELPVVGEIRILDRDIPCRWIPEEDHQDDPPEWHDPTIPRFLRRPRYGLTTIEKYGEAVFAFVPPTLDGDWAKWYNGHVANIYEHGGWCYSTNHHSAVPTHWIAKHLNLPDNVCAKICTFYAVPWSPKRPYFLLEKNDVVIRILWRRPKVVDGEEVRAASTFIVARRRMQSSSPVMNAAVRPQRAL